MLKRISLPTEHMKHEFVWISGQAHTREVILSSAAPDSYTTQPLSINNEKGRSSTEKARQKGGRWVEAKQEQGGTKRTSKGSENSKVRKDPREK